MQRPASITVFGILNFVFVVFGIIGLIASFSLFSVPTDSSNSVIQLINQGPAYVVWLKICIPLGVLSCAILLAAGIGLLCLKPWARLLSIVYSIYAIIFTVVGMTVNLLLMAQPFFQQVGGRQEFEAAFAIGGPLSGTLGGIFWVVYPVALLVFMLSPKVVTAFCPSVSVQT